MAYAGDLKSLAARIVGSSPTAPTIWSFRARVPKGCGLVSFGRRWGSNPRRGERQADAQRPQRAGEGAGRRPKPVRICAANTQTSHRPYHVLFTSPCPLGMRARFLWMPVDFRSCGGIVPTWLFTSPFKNYFTATYVEARTFFDGKTWLTPTFFDGKTWLCRTFFKGTVQRALY